MRIRRHRLRELALATAMALTFATSAAGSGCAALDPGGDDAPPAGQTDQAAAAVTPAPAAATPVTVTIDTGAPGAAIPADFAGLSFETGSERANNAGVHGYFFDPDNTEALTLFQQIGIKNLRMGGGSVDNTQVPALVDGQPDFTGIDKLFGFAGAANLRVIYSVRLLSGNADDDAAIVAHIWKRYRAEVQSFAIGNEPDWRSYHYPPAGTGPDPEIVYYKTSVAHQGYVQKWRAFTTALAGTVSGAPLSGPDTGSNWPVANTSPPYGPSIDTRWSGLTWTANFARDISTWAFPGAGRLAYVTQHNYPGQSVTWRDDAGTQHTLTTQQIISGMLSPTWDSDDYPALYRVSGTPALPAGVGMRLTESNPFTGAVDGGSDAFATALWALDYMHWWAAHDCLGVNFHNKQWGANNVITYDGTSYRALPIAAGIKAWDLGGHGRIEPVQLDNSAGLNLTAYATGSAGDLYLTIVNKEHGGGARDAAVAIAPEGYAAASAASMILTGGRRGDASPLHATLGGAAIENHGRWQGRWTALAPCTAGSCTVTVAAASAAVVHLRAAGAYAGPVQIHRDGALDLFGTTQEGVVERDLQAQARVPDSGAQSFGGWTDTGGTSGPRAAGAVAVGKNLDGTLAMVLPGHDGHVHARAQIDPEGDFGPWVDLGGDHLTGLRIARGADGSLTVFGTDGGGHIWTASQVAPGGAFTDWTDLGGAALQPGFAVGQDLSGALALVAVDDQHHAWLGRQGPDGAFAALAPLESPALDPALVMARDLDGRLEVFGVDVGGVMWRAQETAPGSGFDAFRRIPGVNLQPGFVVGQNKDGRLVLVGVDRQAPHEVYSVWQTAPGEVFESGAWADLGGADLDPRLAVATTADRRMQLFGMGKGGHLWSAWQAGSGDGWSDWTDMGDAGGVQLFPGEPAPAPPDDPAGTDDSSTSSGCSAAPGRGAAGGHAAPVLALLLAGLAWLVTTRERRP